MNQPATNFIHLMAAAVLLTGCDTSSLPEVSKAQRASNECPSTANNDYYYPQGALGKTYGVDLTERSEYSRFLAAIGAPSLSCGASSAEAYRLVWVHSTRPAVVISVNRSEDTATVSAVVFERPGSAKPVAVTKRVERVLTSDETREFFQTVKESGFWNLPSSQPSSADDGDWWVLEGRVNLGYHVVERKSPVDGPSTSLRSVLFKLAGIDRTSDNILHAHGR